MTRRLPPGPAICILHKATLSRLGVIADPPNTYKQNREAAKMRRHRNMPQMKNRRKFQKKTIKKKKKE